jgi:hypothetical protein
MNLQDKLKNPRIFIRSSKLIKTLGDLEVYTIQYTSRIQKNKRLWRLKEGIMVFSNGVYGVGKTIRGAKRNFLRKIGLN